MTTPPPPTDVRYAPRTMLVRFTDPADATPQTMLSDITGTPPGREIGFGLVPGLREWAVPEGMERAMADLASAMPGVEYACLDVVGGELAQVGGQFPVFPNDPDFPKLWWAWNTGQNINGFAGIPGADVCLPDAWKVRTDASSVIVAVMDTGVNYLRPDLAPNIWTNTAEANGAVGIDDDANGVVDDIHGAAFVKKTFEADPACGGTGNPGFCGGNCAVAPCDYGDGDPYDIAPEGGDICPTKNPAWPGSHGTVVAQTLGAVGNNGLDSTGAMWHGTIVPIRIFSRCTQYRGGMQLSDVIDALGYAAMMDAQIINASYGHGYSLAYQDAYKNLEEYDILLVAAAFNNGYDLDATPPNVAPWPASFNFPHVVTVMGTFPDDNPGSCPGLVTSYGLETVEVAAPGFLLTHFPGPYAGFGLPVCGPAGCTICGTSFSAPIVAGIAALYRAEYPNATASQVREAIIQTARPVPQLADKCVAGGVINAAALLGAECSH